MNRPSRLTAASGGVLLLGSLALAASLGGNASAQGDHHQAAAATGTTTHARLNALNNSGVQGRAQVVVNGHRLNVSIDARGLLRGMPHAQHIHFGAQARHECPTALDDANHDFRLTTAEGLPAYGPIRKSLTTRGGTGPASGLAVHRFPTARNGQIHYNRIMFGNDAVARGIRNGQAVVVIHGIDYNGNGKYDFAAAGKSELDPSLPAEATDPVVCGVLRVN